MAGLVLTAVLESMGIDRVVRRVVRPLLPRWRTQNSSDRMEFRRILGGLDPASTFGLDAYAASRSLLIVGYARADLAAMQAPVILAARLAGFRVAVILPAEYFASASFYRSIGASEIVRTDVRTASTPTRRAKEMIAALETPTDLLDLHYDGVPVGKFAASTLMRQTRSARIDPSDKALRPKLIAALSASLRAVESARQVLARTRPELVVFYDRGYTPDGELFELALKEGARAITMNTAHKSGHLLFKRYDRTNKDLHPGAPSARTWKRLTQLQWTPAHWDALRFELKSCYESGLWYDEVGTQFNKRTVERSELAASLKLDASKPTAVVFPHLFWDATFFWGTDLFEDYRDWFVNVLIAAAKNPALNWIVKIHPANLVKNQRDRYFGEFSEVEAIRETLGELPGHIRVIPPDSPISTYSLFDLMDYCLTVRGTVGLEAAIFGKQVLTAGTGRYDGFGFTLDSSSRDEYLGRLATLQTIPQPSTEQTELARRYGYGLFLQRPLETTSLRFRYDQNEKASLRAVLALPAEGRLEGCADLRLLADWLAATSDDDLLRAEQLVPA